jgi:Tfp pilus assembly protein PilP
MMRRNSIAGIVGGVLLLLVWGAGPVASRAAETKAVPPAQPATQPVPAAVPAVPPDYRYSPAGKPDPFKPFMETGPALKTKKEEDLGKKTTAKGRPISPLQQAELGQFRLLGIAGDENRRTAIVADGTTKKFYPLFLGTYIGLNEGRVAEILTDRVVVEERVEAQGNKRKKLQMRRIPMLLHQEP